jgi:hypothetical protein
MVNLLFKDADSTTYNYLGTGKLQNIGEEALLPSIKVTFLTAKCNMRAHRQYVALENI